MRFPLARSMLYAGALLLGGAAAAHLAGCNVIGFLGAQAMPPPRVPATYELPEAPTAVLVDVDPALSGELGPMDAETVAIALERALRDRAKAQIATEAAAVQVVRARLAPPSIDSPTGSSYRTGLASAHVRVVRADGTELWPNDGSPGWPVQVETSHTRGHPADVRRATLRALGQQIAALFHSREMRPDE